ncbi:MAG: thioredoxin family protein [Chlamydiota bacterium]|nr:thioredoxin family protein [Chlamydiota bacterium]
MKKNILYLVYLLTFICISQDVRAASIEWTTSYEEALEQSKMESKPVILFFTGSDWCTWCKKLEEESLDTNEFAQSAGDKFIFLLLDYPMRSRQTAGLIEQNKQLQQKFEVKSFPSLILMSPNGKQIGITGYRKGGGKQYAEHLIKMVEDFTSYNNNVENLQNEVLSGTALKHLYRKAKEFDDYDDQNKIIKLGMKSDRADYFMIERYRFLAREGQIHDTEALSLREQLLASDPNNHKFTHYQVACIEFDAYIDEMEKENYSADIAVAPLVNYISKFSEQDPVNLWRMHIIISQVYSDKQVPSKALKFAKCAHECAPEESKSEIAMVISNIELQL